MNRPDAREKPANGAPEAEIICAKCHYHNPRGRNACEKCGAHLHVSCHYCGYRNHRSHLHCQHCGERLHRSRWRRWKKALFPDRARVKPAHLAIMLVVVFVAYKVIIRLTEIQF